MERLLKLPYSSHSKDSLSERRAKITATIYLILLVVTPIGMFFRHLAKGNFYPLDFAVLGAIFLAYLSTRTKYYWIGTGALVLFMCFIAYIGAAKHIDSGNRDVTSYLVWFALPLFIISLIFSWRAVMVIAPLPTLFLIVFIFQKHPANWGALMAVLSIGALISILIAYTRDTDLQLISEQNARLLRTYEETLEAWARVLETRDQETKGHSERVVGLMIQLAKTMGIQDKDQLQFFRYGSLLHDIWKAGYPRLDSSKTELSNR